MTPSYGPTSRAELLGALRRAGFVGPFAGGNHQYMEKGDLRVRIPNPHRGDIGVSLLARILRQANLTRAEWETL